MKNATGLFVLLVIVMGQIRFADGAESPPSAAAIVSVDWTKVELTSRTAATLQVVVNPMLRRGAMMHDGAFAALRDLRADYVRYVPWLPYPKLAVAELEPPTADKTFWDFSAIDPMTIDFLDACAGHSVILNFSTIPQWMFKTPARISYPDDPNQVFWDYTHGTELRDPSMKELADYYARLVNWYHNGGFTDENGVRHDSGYHYPIPYWEVFNEVDSEHQMTAQQYTQRYDAVVGAIHRVSPETRFVGLALAIPKGNLPFFEYFLNPQNHAPGSPIDMISYHFYATPAEGEKADQWQNTFFSQAEDFLATVGKIEAIRRRLSPETQTTIDELGVILPNDNNLDPANRIPAIYWNAAASLYAYLFIELAKRDIDVVGESQLVGYATQYPSVTMIDYTNAKPNARYWVLKLIKDNFEPGDLFVHTNWESPAQPGDDLEIQAFKSSGGRRLLLINKRNSSRSVILPEDAKGGRIERVTLATGDNPPSSETLKAPEVTLGPFDVAVVQLAQ